jgi:hypothetical protein
MPGERRHLGIASTWSSSPSRRWLAERKIQRIWRGYHDDNNGGQHCHSRNFPDRQ